MKTIILLSLFFSLSSCNNGCEDGGVANGKIMEYFANGKIKKEYYFENCLYNGKYYEYYLSESVKLEGVFKKGQRIGEWFSYDTEGKITCKQTYENGILKSVSAKEGKNEALFLYKDKIIIVNNRDTFNINTHKDFPSGYHSSYEINIIGDSIMLKSDNGLLILENIL